MKKVERINIITPLNALTLSLLAMLATGLSLTSRGNTLTFFDYICISLDLMILYFTMVATKRAKLIKEYVYCTLSYIVVLIIFYIHIGGR